MEITVKTAEQLRLTAEEFELIKKKLGRTPNFNELCAFSGMWSEHCSYKNSIKWLKTLPRDGGRMLVAAGEENAGLMDIGDGAANSKPANPWSTATAFRCRSWKFLKGRDSFGVANGTTTIPCISSIGRSCYDLFAPVSNQSRCRNNAHPFWVIILQFIIDRIIVYETA